MNNQWMIDVLKDMRQVAQTNAMLDFAESLDDAIIVAASELRSRSLAHDAAEGHDCEAREFSDAFGGYGNTQRPPDAC